MFFFKIFITFLDFCKRFWFRLYGLENCPSRIIFYGYCVSLFTITFLTLYILSFFSY